MFRKSRLSRAAALAVSGLAVLGGDVLAQDSTQRVEVTGSNIRRTDTETPSPVQVITNAELKASGFTQTQDVLHNITANNNGTLAQGFNGAFAGGASGISLRGLTVGATLVLIDGHRMAPYPLGDDGQRSFVDIANIPFDSIDRIEILKDGASAIYGSDAMAGVVNIILKKTFVGLTLTADAGTSGHGDGQAYHVAGTWGAGDLKADGRNFYISGEARKQNEILYADRSPQMTTSDLRPQGGYNVTNGVPNALTGSTPRSSGTGYIVDPATGTKYFMPGCDNARLGSAALGDGQCGYADTWNQVQPKTENYNLVARYTQALGADWQANVQGTWFRSKSQQVVDPQRAFSAGFQGITSGPGVSPAILPPVPATTISSTNPSFPASALAAGVTTGTLRYTFLNVGPRVTDFESTSTRLVAEVDGKAGAWDLNFAGGLTKVKLNINNHNYVQAAALQTALDSTTAPFLVGQPNSASVNALIAPDGISNDESTLNFLNVSGSREVYQLSGGPMSLALGAQYFVRKQNALAPPDVANGLVPNANNNFTVGEQQVGSVFGELVAPVTKQVELDAALRYDHYNISGGKASPKVGFKYTPMQEIAFRGTWGKGFRAPSPAENGQAGQTFFAGTFSDPILCPDGQPATIGNFPSACAFPIASIQATTPTLKAETSTSWTLGLIFEPIKNVSFSLDYYNINIKDQIITDTTTNIVRGTNFAAIPQVIDAAGNTALVVPPVAPIAYQQAGYINANQTQTSGVDLGARYLTRFEDVGTFKTEFMWSYIINYDMTIDGVKYKLAGTHGPFVVSGDTGTPRSRIQWANTLARNGWSTTLTMNYIAGYDVTDPSSGMPDCLSGLRDSAGAASVAFAGVLGNDIIPNQSMCNVPSFTTWDLYGSYSINKNFSIHGSITNLFDRKFPQDWSTYGGSNAYVPYNPSLHSAGAIGRFFNIGLTYAFY